MIFKKFSDHEKKEIYIRFAVFSFIMFLFIFPIIHANFYYQDDYYRALTGKIFMGKLGRFLTYLIFFLPTMQKHLVDTAPLFQILSIFVTSGSITLLSFSWKMNRLSAFIGLPLIFCFPFFLSDLSYRFDSLSISLSVSVIILSFCYIQPRLNYTTIILLLLCSLNLYQAAISVFLVMSCMLGFFVLMERGGKASFILYSKLLCCFLSSLLLYKAELLIIGLKGYGAEHGKLSFHAVSVLSNAHHFAALAFSEFGLYGGNLEVILGILLALGFCKGLYELATRRGLSSLVWGVIYVSLAFLSLSGIMIFLKFPIFISRIMVANGAILSFAVICLIGRESKFRSFQRLPVILGAWALCIQMSISYQWGNLNHNQALWEGRIAARMVDDLYEISSGSKIIVRLLPYHTIPFSELDPEVLHDIRTETKDTFNFPMQPVLIYRPDTQGSAASSTTQDSPVESDKPRPLVYDVPISPLAARIWHTRPSLSGDRRFLFSDPPWGHIALINNGLQSNALILTSLWNNKKFSYAEAEKIRHNCHYTRVINNIFYSMYKYEDKVVVDFSHACLPKDDDTTSSENTAGP